MCTYIRGGPDLCFAAVVKNMICAIVIVAVILAILHHVINRNSGHPGAILSTTVCVALLAILARANLSTPNPPENLTSDSRTPLSPLQC